MKRILAFLIIVATLIGILSGCGTPSAENALPEQESAETQNSSAPPEEVVLPEQDIVETQDSDVPSDEIVLPEQDVADTYENRSFSS